MIGFTGSSLLRAADHQVAQDALDAALAHPGARLLRMEGVDPAVDADGALLWGGPGDAPAGAPLALMGWLDDAPCFVALTPTPGGARRSPALMALLDRWEAPVAALWATARGLIDWHARNGFCAMCGTPTNPIRGGWARACPGCRAEHFPRTDPVAIMLAEHDGRVLVGRQAAWPRGRYSALAGFVELAESLEEAVARELFEEAGVRASAVRYVASQPWPFPSQLMLACIATAESDALSVDRAELEDAIWVDRAGVRAALAGQPDAPFLPPPPYAIARSLLEHWVAAEGQAGR